MLLFCLVVVGCSKSEIVDVKNVDKQDTNEAIEYTYTDLRDLCDEFWGSWVNETEKLSEAEFFGTSDDEEKRNKQFYEVSNKYAQKVFENFEIKQGQKVIVTGYISAVTESDKNSFMSRCGVDRFFFYLKHRESDDKYDGISCRTSDERFLSLEENTPIKIEGIFIKEGDMVSENDLYDCRIIE